MKVLIALDYHFFRTPDGLIWNDSIIDYSFWHRYLQVFDTVLVLARVNQVLKKEDKWVLANGENVEFCCIPDYTGPWQYLAKYRKVKKTVNEAIKRVDCAILRNGVIGNLAWDYVKRRQIPVAIEVVGDPWEALAPGTIKSIVRPYVRLYFTWLLKRQCREANAVSYVTKYALQKRYPPGNGHSGASSSDKQRPCNCFATHYSSIDINLSLIEYKYDNGKKNTRVRIINAGTMATLYKAQHIQIKALKVIVDRGFDAELVLIGDGCYRREFEELASELGLVDRVIFLGMLPGSAAVMKELSRADLFILPSFVEGLPRALIEAMAIGLPCIATNVGGIPELLQEDELVPPRDYFMLAEKIIEVISDEERMTAMSKRNIMVAQEYDSEVLNQRRMNFYKYLKGIVLSEAAFSKLKKNTNEN